ncbi:MAG TPA: SusC/RagA family TonB-linked outer membrane protein [Gemmatimonadaceae bacterium]|nr:SusC/RagA family TonB-linked outer membrane protein [Gemmatimonadaceae bacterium]
MKGLRTFISVALALAFLPAFAAAQQGATISGRVTSDAGDALPGASVFLEGLSLGSTTDNNGRYTFSVPDARVRGQTATITARRIGHTVRSAQITLASGNITQNFTLSANPLRLGEVVVTGAGTTRVREKLGAVINTVDSTLIQRSGETNIVQALAGKAPNVQINQQSGEAGASSSIRIRGAKSITGTGQPLFVVDGVPIDNTTFATGPATAGTVAPNRASDINPADIASIEILKGAAGAIYGARAAEGVVLITTKSGVSGPTKWSIRSNVGWSDVNKGIPLQRTFGHGGGGGITASNDDCIIRDLRDCVTTGNSYGPRLTRDDYLVALRSRLTALGRDPATAESVFAGLYPNGITTYDHFNELFDTGVESDITLSASGGSDRTTFYMSVGRLDQTGIIIGPNNSYDRTTTRLKASHRLTDRFLVGGNVSYIDTRGAFVQKGSNTSGLMLGAMRTPPNFNSDPYIDPETGRHRSYRFPRPSFGSTSSSRIYDNPFFVVNEVVNKSELGRVIGDVNLDYDPFDWLSVDYSFGGDYYTDWRLEGLPLSSGDRSTGRVRRADLLNFQLSHNLSTTARRFFSEKFAATLTLGQALNSRRYRQNYSNGFDLIAAEPFALQNTTTREPQEYRSLIHGESYFALGTADMFNQLYLSASARNDGFSTFGASKPRHWFPSASVSWVPSNWFSPDGQGLLSFAKLRFAFGETGKEPGVYLTTPTTLTVGGDFGSGWGDYVNATQAGIGGLYTSRALGNNSLTPERTRELEGGIDVGLFNQRADIGLTLYNSKSSDVILNVPIAPSTGFTSRLENAAEISNRGVEVTFNARPVTRPRFAWDFGVNFSRNRNHVDDLKGAEFVDKSAGTFSGVYGAVTKGSEVGVIRGEDFVKCGRGLTVGTIDIDNTAGHCQGAPGGALYISASGYPLQDPTDRIIANPNPKWLGSFRTSLNVRGLTFSALLDHKHGGHVWNGTSGALIFFGTHLDTEEIRNTTRTFGKDFLMGDGHAGAAYPVVAGPGAGKPVLIGQSTWYQSLGSSFTGPDAQSMEDGTYTKLRELAVSFTISPIFVQRFGVGAVDLRLAGRNLKTWTDYTGIDPETNLGGAEVFVQGVDYFNNPQTRTFILSVGLTR